MVANIFQAPLDLSHLNQISSDINRDVFAEDIQDHILPDHASGSRQNKSHKDYDQFSWHNGFLFRGNLVYIPDGPA
jgi:hypothetical protein